MNCFLLLLQFAFNVSNVCQRAQTSIDWHQMQPPNALYKNIQRFLILARSLMRSQPEALKMQKSISGRSGKNWNTWGLESLNQRLRIIRNPSKFSKPEFYKDPRKALALLAGSQSWVLTPNGGKHEPTSDQETIMPRCRSNIKSSQNKKSNRKQACSI